MSSLALAVVVLASFGAPARAQEFPRFDMDAKCASTGNRAAANVCLEKNQRSYEIVRDRWDAYPNSSKAKCIAMATPAIYAYYTLYDCLSQMERYE